MANIKDVIRKMEVGPNQVRFSQLCKVCDYYFGPARQTGSSHRIYKTPWAGDPRVNIQSSKGRAKAYQVKQALLAIKKLETHHET